MSVEADNAQQRHPTSWQHKALAETPRSRHIGGALSSPPAPRLPVLLAADQLLVIARGSRWSVVTIQEVKHVDLAQGSGCALENVTGRCPFRGARQWGKGRDGVSSHHCRPHAAHGEMVKAQTTFLANRGRHGEQGSESTRGDERQREGKGAMLTMQGRNRDGDIIQRSSGRSAGSKGAEKKIALAERKREEKGDSNLKGCFQ